MIQPNMKQPSTTNQPVPPVEQTVQPTRRPVQSASHEGQTTRGTGPSKQRAVRDDDRAVSEILGAILVFGILIALLFLVQMTAVPTWNQQVEFDHNERAQADIGELGNAIERVDGSGVGETVTVELGTRYPTRPLLYNPPSVSGTLRTTPHGEIVIEGARSTGDVGDYWDGSTVRYDTRTYAYSVEYNEFSDAPDRTRYEHGTVANQFGGDVTIVEQARPVISGNQISLVTLTGDSNRTSVQPFQVPVTPVSDQSRTVSVSGVDGEDITLSLRTALPEDTWQEMLVGELDTGNLVAIEYVPGPEYATVTLALDGTETYTLRTSRVGIGADIDQTTPAYLDRVQGGGTYVPVGSTDRLTVEVRDQFNAPKSGVAVTYQVVQGSGTFADDPTPGDGNFTVSSDPRGSTSVVFSPQSAGQVVVEATATLYDSPGTQAAERVRFELSTTASDGSGDDDGVINPNDPSSVRLAEVTTAGSTAVLEFENLATTAVDWSQIRISFVSKQAGQTGPFDFEITPENRDPFGHVVGDDFVEITPTPLQFGPGGTAGAVATVTVDLTQSGPGFSRGDFLVLNVRNQEHRLATYFVGMQ